jgi:formylglycine-generating enzyme required for sulfatase activity
MPEKLDLNFVLVPGGKFLMGSVHSRDQVAANDEMPQHALEVSDFYVMRYPVTNEQYYQFMQAAGQRAPLFWKDGHYPADKADHPVVGVSFLDAVAFCRWAREMSGLSVRIPSEPEWEKAARGADGRVYPWGDKWETGRANTVEAKTGGTTPVGQFSPQGDSIYGVACMAGNVQQWTSSLYGNYPYNSADGREKFVYDLDSPSLFPEFHETGGTMRLDSDEAGSGKTIIRGGSYREHYNHARAAYRSWAPPMHRSEDTGFRCCYEPE